MEIKREPEEKKSYGPVAIWPRKKRHGLKLNEHKSFLHELKFRCGFDLR